jgi:Ca2+-binding EF-hand superfamily protein
MVLAAFERFDLNGDGSIDAHEIKIVMAEVGTPLTDLEVDEMIAKADLNGDGLIDFQEFLTMAAGLLALSV